MNFLRNELVEIFSLYGRFEIVIRCQIDVALESVKFSREKYKLCDFFDILFNSMYELKMLYIFFFFKFYFVRSASMFYISPWDNLQM